MDEKIITDLAGQVKDMAVEIKNLTEAPTVRKEDLEAAHAEIAELKNFTKSAQAEFEATKQKLAEYKALLRHDFGKSGADDWRSEFSTFIKQVYHLQTKKPMPAWLTKATGDLVSDVDASGGYLVPRAVADEITRLTLRSGKVWPELTKYTMPAGLQMRVPWPSTLSSVAWRSGASSLPGQGTAATQMDPVPVFGADTLKPDWVRGWQPISNEAMTAPGVSLPDEITMQLMEQIVRRIEKGVLAGYDGTTTQHTSATDPHDGILYAANVNEQAAMATVTYALVKTFIGDCIEDHEGAAETSENYLITTDSVAHILKGNMTQTGVTWGDPGRTWEPYVHGYRLLTHPESKRVHSTASHDYMILSPLRKIKVGWTGQFFVSFNESLGWASNETYLMVSTHADYALGNPDMHHNASFTAYV
jgi:HK97 family phage major capsid protein